MTGPANIFQIERADMFGNPRKVALKLVFTLLLGLPFVIADMPGTVRLSGIGFLILFSCFFGASVGMVRRKTAGLTRRLALLPIPGVVWLADLVLAGAVVDFIQTGTIIALYLLIHSHGVSVAAVIVIAALFASTVLILNALGIMLGRWLSNNAEVHLAGALSTLMLAFASGLMPTPARLLPVQSMAARYNPLSVLLRRLCDCTTDGTGVSSAFIVPALAIISILAAVILYRWRRR